MNPLPLIIFYGGNKAELDLILVKLGLKIETRAPWL